MSWSDHHDSFLLMPKLSVLVHNRTGILCEVFRRTVPDFLRIQVRQAVTPEMIVDAFAWQ